MRLLLCIIFLMLIMCGCNVEHVMVHALPTHQAFTDKSEQISGPPQANISWQSDSDTIRVPYHPSYHKTGCMAVEGIIRESKTSYPIVLDTGAAGAVVVNDIHVRQHRLPVTPWTRSIQGDRPGLGLCRLEGLRIGTMTLEAPSGWYSPLHRETRFLGMTLAQDDAIILGLPALKTLSYLLFDNIAQEAELSLSRPFQPQHPDQWSTYPLAIKTNAEGFLLLVVSLPLAGQVMDIQLDTGSGRGLAVTEQQWQQLAPTLKTSKLLASSNLYPYIGRLPCKQGVIEHFRLGNDTIDRSSVSVYAANRPLLTDCDALIGMQCFKNKILVVDFYQNKLWIKSDLV